MNNRPVILIVDDEITNIEIMNAVLEDTYEISFATSGEQALDVARVILPDLILLDVLMPGINGYDVCERIKSEPLLADVPVIFTTGLTDADAEVRGLTLGAIDYITKPIQPVVLKARVANHIELKRIRDQLAQMAVTDALTGLSNRRHLENTIKHEITKLSKNNNWLSVILLDIDFFKSFNDTYGHPEGDRCLVMVASALNRAIHLSNNTLARYGGEEFVCVLPNADLSTAMSMAHEIKNQVHTLNIPHSGSSVSPFITVSLGVASAIVKGDMVSSDWISQADRQLYLSKKGGRDTISGTTFEPETT
ncbi:diguanylate cyclase [Brucellaceae bacterium C25G]